MGLGIRIALLCALVGLPPVAGAELCLCSEEEPWCADYVEGREAFNVGDLERAKELLARAGRRHPRDACRIKVDNFPESYRPFYCLARVYLELQDPLQAWQAWERSNDYEALSDKERNRFAAELEGISPEPELRERILAWARAKVRRCREHAGSWPECRGIEGRRQKLSKRCARAAEQLQKAERSLSPALAEQAGRTADGAMFELQALFCSHCDEECSQREELLQQIEELAGEARELERAPLAERFVHQIDTIEALIAASGELPADAPLEALKGLREGLRRAMEALREAMLAAPFRELAPGVVKIEAPPGIADPPTGSGIVVHLAGRRALVLTATHVVHDGEKVARNIGVTFATRPDRWFPAQVLEIEADDPNGLALLALEGDLPPARCLPLAEIQPERTQTVYIIGMARAAETDWTITVGRAAGREGTKMSLAVPAFGGGSSGGPVILAGGRVVGMVAAAGAGGFVLAVPAPFLRYALGEDGWGVEPCGVAGGEGRDGGL